MVLTKLLDWRKIDPEKHFKYAPEVFRSGRSVSLMFTVTDPETGKECWMKHQTPANMLLPFGINRTQKTKTFKDKDDKMVTKEVVEYKCSFGLQVKFDPTSKEWIGPEEHVAYRDWLEKVQHCHIKHCWKNSKVLWKKQKSFDVVEEMFYKSFYMNEGCLKGLYNPTYTATIVYENGEFGTGFYKREVKEDGTLGSRRVKYEDFACPGEKFEGMKDFDVRATLLSKTIWFSGTILCGVKEKVQQMLIYETNQFNVGGCELALDDDPCTTNKRTHEDAFGHDGLVRTGTEELPASATEGAEPPELNREDDAKVKDEKEEDDTKVKDEKEKDDTEVKEEKEDKAV